MYNAVAGVLALILTLGTLSCNSKPEPTSRSEILVISAKTFVVTMAKEDYTAAEKDFSAELKTKLPPEKLKEIWKAVINQAGAFKEQLDPQTAKSLEQNVVYDILVIPCRFERSTLNLRLAFNDQNQIAGMFFVAPT